MGGSLAPVVETVIEPGNEPSFGKLLDLTMLVLPGGKERTAQEYETLFARSGFRLNRIVPTHADVPSPLRQTKLQVLDPAALVDEYERSLALFEELVLRRR